MNYAETVSWLETPRKGLPRGKSEDFQKLMAGLGNPQDRLRFVHVTGSNGKGSICAMSARILEEAGYKTGLFTSPHLSVYNERILVDRQMISDADFVRLAEMVRPRMEAYALSWGLFYKLTAMAFLYFAEQECEIVVLEVGRGGFRDCTNIVRTTELAMIGNIGLEHTEVLGDTLEKIAYEKSGILKPGCAAVLYAQTREVEQVVRERAAELGCAFRISRPEEIRLLSFEEDRQFMDFGPYKKLELSLPGTYQLKNAAVVLEGMALLNRRGWHIGEEQIRRALADLSWPGRFELLQKDPVIFGDGAHNSNAVEQLTECLKAYFPGERFRFVLTLLWDRNWKEMLDMLAPFARDFIAVQVEDYKALSAAELASYIRESLGFPALEASSEQEALEMALAAQKRDGTPVGILGSIYLLGALRDLLKNK